MSQNFCLHTNLKKSPLITPCLQHPSEFRKSHLARLDFQSFLLNYIFIGNSQVLFCSSKLLLLASVNIMGPICANFHFFPLIKISIFAVFGHFLNFFCPLLDMLQKNTVVKIHWQPISRTMVYLPFPRFQKMRQGFLCFFGHFHLWD